MLKILQSTIVLGASGLDIASMAVPYQMKCLLTLINKKIQIPVCHSGWFPIPR